MRPQELCGYERLPAREREPLREREEAERERPLDEPERADVLREREELEPPLRVDRDDVDRLREVELVRRRLEVERRRRPVERCDAGIDSVATALVSCGISRSRKPDIRSSSRRMRLASWAVSLSPTVVASVSIAV
jgi:hypothetical protein